MWSDPSSYFSPLTPERLAGLALLRRARDYADLSPADGDALQGLLAQAVLANVVVRDPRQNGACLPGARVLT